MNGIDFMASSPDGLVLIRPSPLDEQAPSFKGKDDELQL